MPQGRPKGWRVDRDGVILRVPEWEAWNTDVFCSPQRSFGIGNGLLALQILVVPGVSWSLLGTPSENSRHPRNSRDVRLGL